MKNRCETPICERESPSSLSVEARTASQIRLLKRNPWHVLSKHHADSKCCRYATDFAPFYHNCSYFIVGTCIAKDAFDPIAFPSRCFAMKNSSPALNMFLLSSALGLVLHGLFILGQSTIQAAPENGWRRTVHGWEYADSLPMGTDSAKNREDLRFPTLRIPMESIHRAHRFALPLAIAGFMACLGPWMLLKWPTPDSSASRVLCSWNALPASPQEGRIQ